jgi:hypothetical protein
MSSSERPQHAAAAALSEARHNPVWSAEIHALVASEARLAQFAANRPGLVVAGWRLFVAHSFQQDGDTSVGQ